MAGANYMGGKRNAARARVKDAAGKAQRSHFGKKRLEVLRTGLSKGNAAGAGSAKDIRKGVPEISLAHARRFHTVSRSEVEGGWNGPKLRSASQKPYRQSSPLPSSASGRSKILQVLDAESPVARRTQVEKILQIPDLLGLSMTKTSSFGGPLYTPIRGRNTSYKRRKVSRNTSSDISTTTVESSAFTFVGSKPQGENSVASDLQPAVVDPAFVPMFLDSSPCHYVEDSGYAEWGSASRSQTPSTHDAYEPARIPFYPVLVDAERSHSSAPSAPLSPRSFTPSPQYAWTDSSQKGVEYLSSYSTASYLNFSGSSRLASPSQADLPSPPVRAQFLSDVPSPGRVPGLPDLERSKLPPLDLSSFSSSRPTSRLVNSEDPPQATYTHSPHDCARSEVTETLYDDETCDTGYASESSLDSLLGDAPPGDIPKQCWEEDEWESFYLVDVLGDLFENADPWSTLNEVLALHPRPMNASSSPTDLLSSHVPQDRSGVGYMLADGSPASNLHDYPKPGALPDVDGDNDPGYSLIGARTTEGSLYVSSSGPGPPTQSANSVTEVDPSSLCDLPVEALMGEIERNSFRLPEIGRGHVLLPRHPSDTPPEKHELASLALEVELPLYEASRDCQTARSVPSESQRSTFETRSGSAETSCGESEAVLVIKKNSKLAFADGPCLFADDERLSSDEE